MGPQDQAQAEPSDTEGDGDPLASIAQRVGARVIDWLLLFAISAAIGLIAVGGDPAAVAAGETEVPRWSGILSVVLIFVYETVLVAWRGQTLGKMVVGIELVSLASGRTPTAVAAAARATPVVSILVVLGSLPQASYPALVLLYYSAAFMRHQRGILDRIAGTVVIQGRRPSLLKRSLG